MKDLPDDQPSVSGGVTGKEQEIVGGESYLEEAEKLPELAAEVERAGVKPVREEIELPSGLPPGITPAGPATPVTTQPTGLVKLPLTEEQIQKALHRKIVDSILWLAYWCLRQIKIAHQRIRYGRR